MKTFDDIIGLWPSTRDMGADLGVGAVTVRSWRFRKNGIPTYLWPRLLLAASKRQIEGLNFEQLIAVSESHRDHVLRGAERAP